MLKKFDVEIQKKEVQKKTFLTEVERNYWKEQILKGITEILKEENMHTFVEKRTRN